MSTVERRMYGRLPLWSGDWWTGPVAISFVVFRGWYIVCCCVVDGVCVGAGGAVIGGDGGG